MKHTERGSFSDIQFKKLSPPSHKIIYNRGGNLSAVIQLDQEKADKFMKVADMRRDIVITDSDTPSEQSPVPVSTNTLAFCLIEPITRLTEIHFRPKPLHTLVFRNDHFELQVLERAIDDKIRSGHPIDQVDYNEQFLKMLNKTVRTGISEVIGSEKLGIRDQGLMYLFQGVYLSQFLLNFTMHNGASGQWWNHLLIYLSQCIGVNSILHTLDRKDESSLTQRTYSRRYPEDCLIPLLFPLDRWIRSQVYLARNGEKMIILKPPQETPTPSVG